MEKKTCVISCGILRKEIERLVEGGLCDIDLHFLDSRLHCDYSHLRKALKQAIEERLVKCSNRLIIVYGDLCLGFNNEMKELIEEYGAIKVDALNCIDCLLGGKARLLEIDPKHKYLFLNSAWIAFLYRFGMGSKRKARKQFSMLQGIVLLDALGDLERQREEIKEISELTGLPIIKKKEVGLEGLKKVIEEAIGKVLSA